METGSLSLKQPEPLGNVLGGEIRKTTVNSPELKANAPSQKLFPGKTKVKKKMRVEDIITNLAKKVQQITPAIEDDSKKASSVSEKKSEISQQAENTATKENGNTATKERGRIATKEKDVSSSEEPQEEDISSFASMCTIRDDPPEYNDLSELPSLVKESIGQSSVLQDKKTSPGTVVQSQKKVQTNPAVSNPPQPLRQVILQTVPQRANQQTPIILNKLPSGFIIRSDLPSGSFPNLQTTTSGQPKLLLITKSGGPFYLTQNVNTTSSQTQAKPGNKSDTSPVSTQTKTIIGSNTSTTLLNGKPMNSNKSILKLTSPSKTSAETPLITVQYNLPYPNNNCKVVNNPVNVRAAQHLQPGTFQTLGNLPGVNKVLVPGLPRPSRPREMVVNFAGSQTAHITTMTDESSVPPQKQTKFIPSFVYGSSPETAAIKKTHLSPEKRNDKTIFIVTSPSAATNSKINTNKKVTSQSTQRKSIYDEKIAKLTGKMTNINQAPAVNGKVKTLPNGHQKKSSVLTNNVRVSNRKRQQTERAKLFEKETKKRKRSDEKSPVKDKPEMVVKIKVEKADNITSPKAVSPTKHETPSSPSKKSKDVSPQQTLVENVPVKKDDDPDSLFRDPALLTREERALQRALMRFKELEEKQARKESVSEAEKTSSRKIGKTVQLNKTSDVQRKRKMSNELDVDVITLKQRKREMKNETIRAKAEKVERKEANQETKDSEVIVEPIKLETNLATDTPDTISVPSSEKRKEIRKKVTLPKKTEIKPDTIKDNSTKEPKHLKSVKDVIPTPKVVKPLQKTPDSASEKHRVKTYMLVPSYHGFKDFSPIVLGSRTRSRKTEPVPTEKEDEVPVTKPAEKSEKEVPLLVVETVGNKAVKQDVVAKDEQLRDLVKNSLRKQGMLKQELELNERNEDAEQFENREKRNLSINRNTGETVLHKASRMGYDETVYHCIQQGSDSNAKDNAGWTPLHEACSRGHSDVVRVLLKYNADVNACSNDGIRPIHDAADNGKTDSLRLLMAYGADPFISTYSGRSVLDCAKRTEAKDYIKACIGDLYLNDERNNIAPVDYQNRWDFHGSSCILDKDRKYLGDIFDNVPKQQSSNSMEFEWSETPHLQTYSLPLVKDGIAVGRKNYILFHDLQEALNKPRQNVIRLLKRTKIREISLTEFSKEVSCNHFNKRSECPSGAGEGKIELVPLNWTVRSLLKIKCEHLAL